MFTADTHVQVLNDSMFNALKDSFDNYGKPTVKSGVCGNIHKFLTLTAESMGIEAWIQSGSLQGGAHIWSGMVIGSGEEKQIVFLDEGMLIPTGTLKIFTVGMWPLTQSLHGWLVSILIKNN
ncbi:MAG: hypothetical protein COV32_02055 [Candidatus Yonathbacteria bacterium CG10_big_fil_rev_8_21_14_0_10_43_136]|nr:MAG: hypothetical protein COW60_03040 [Candidatus Yonathbacteria bacterium CG17_big_fil_post_rev_8_21_14_2_50_43_9]PIR40671.1 MAG: hypothetical protein COV32_02055 [Candidatus Yonathbacteria bacterium CG10_big_fil_rev_8_21_14_0_10_43_136]PIX57282.1 MAG: hypothetical protein COZ48_01395 [Candidatus Yonathbacteria bacterium CG_4_10_14_3_um_filter_43_12]PIY58649.1 MAG: hypothetical protein COY98_00845 [Candidatus Yonathbacteria bacterium CG_4_10_14_0_8_um_filter_43_17]